MATVHRRGFSTVGVREITAAAGVAQGSFTNHFASKEEFGVAILDHYFEENRTIIARTLEDESRRPEERLRAYFDTVTDLLAAAEWRYGCMAGNMALEASEHSEPIRERVNEGLRGVESAFATVIREGQAAGEFPAELDPDEVGALLLEAWHGAMLRMKTERSPAPLARFKRIFLPSILGRSQPAHERK